jgi:hypothetical protein
MAAAAASVEPDGGEAILASFKKDLPETIPECAKNNVDVDRDMKALIELVISTCRARNDISSFIDADPADPANVVVDELEENDLDPAIGVQITSGPVKYAIENEDFLKSEQYMNLPRYFFIHPRFRKGSDRIGGEGKYFENLFEVLKDDLLKSKIVYKEGNINDWTQYFYTLGVVLGMHGIKKLFHRKKNKDVWGKYGEGHKSFLYKLIQWRIDKLVNLHDDMCQKIANAESFDHGDFNWTIGLEDFLSGLCGKSPQSNLKKKIQTVRKWKINNTLGKQFIKANGYIITQAPDGRTIYQKIVAADAPSSCHVRR